MKVLKDPLLMKRFMARANVSNHALTIITGVNKETLIRRLEDGDWKMHDLLKIQELLNISKEELSDFLEADEDYKKNVRNEMEKKIDERAEMLTIGKATMVEKGHKYKRNLEKSSRRMGGIKQWINYGRK